MTEGVSQQEILLNLFETCKISLDTPMRASRIKYKKQSYVFEKVENELKRFFYSYVINLWYEEITPNHSEGLKP